MSVPKAALVEVEIEQPADAPAVDRTAVNDHDRPIDTIRMPDPSTYPAMTELGRLLGA